MEFEFVENYIVRKRLHPEFGRSLQEPTHAVYFEAFDHFLPKQDAIILAIGDGYNSDMGRSLAESRPNSIVYSIDPTCNKFVDHGLSNFFPIQECAEVWILTQNFIGPILVV